MTIYGEARGKVIDVGGGSPVFKLIGIAVVGLIVLILLFNSVNRVSTGHVGVLTLFGRVTGEVLPEGIHLINPLKTNNEMSIQTQTIKASIETKQQAEQEALAMNFRLQKEKQEAERKRIEAAGIRDFQQIVAQGISPALLEWKGIEATENLAKSGNSKVVVIGNNKNGLPLILGQ